MNRRGRYYLSRIVKLGKLDQAKLIAAIQNPATVSVGKYSWTITDAITTEKDNRIQYLAGALIKFKPEGTVRVIDDQHKSQTDRPEPNLVIAASPFVYLPEFSGIAYLHVWNQIERETFAKRFAEVIRATYDHFFVDCTIEPITDLRSFAAKLQAIDAFLEISAKVHPPNPLFGNAWKDLNEYIGKRMAAELNIKEKGDEEKPLRTRLVDHVKGLLSQEEGTQYTPSQPVDITDAAVLMAADGYGSGKVVGKEQRSTVVIRTSETHRSFLLSTSAEPKELFEEAERHLKRIAKDRDMRH
jgi:hypothetical protein